MPNKESLEIAAQLWCLPQHSKKVMDCEFSYSIAEALDAAEARGVEKGAVGGRRSAKTLERGEG